MSPLSIPRVGFTTKVLVPVVGIMMVLAILTLWMVHTRISNQVRSSAADELFSSIQTSGKLEALRKREIRLRAGALPNDPRLKSIAQLGDANTLRVVLSDLVEESKMDLLVCSTDAHGALAGASSDPAVQAEELPVPASLLNRARGGESVVGLLLHKHRLYDIVVLPLRIGTDTTGALVAAQEISQQTAEETRQIVGCDVIYVAEKRIVAGSLDEPAYRRRLSAWIAENGCEKVLAGSAKAELLPLTLNNERFLVAGSDMHATTGQAYILLLDSYEPQLRMLRQTQFVLGGFGLVGILVSSLIAWFVIERVSRPLHELQERVEAVGRRDFSQQIRVLSDDEFGDLARAFNLMTRNLNQSTRELEETFATLRTTQAQLLQSEKLSAIGEFIAGVAHELNNPLTILVGFAEMLQESEISQQYKDEIQQINDSADRCHKIVQNLLSFARQTPPEWSPLQINDLLESTVRFLTYELHTSNVDCITDLDPQLPRVMGDPHQLQQVFLNIINNARQAMEERHIKGAITIATSFTDENVQVSLSDTGPGIEPHHMDRLFDPFFTTKAPGKGTGLGLSVSYGIIKEHQGEILVHSTVGSGTAFFIDIPIAPSAEIARTTVRKHGPDSALKAPPGHRVLAVDDEESILMLVSTMLKKAGFVVDTAPDGQTAIQKIRDAHYDLILSDWKMPGITGQELYQRVRELDPSLASRFVFMTGDVMNERMQKFIEDCGAGYVSKPFTLAEFRSVIETIVLR